MAEFAEVVRQYNRMCEAEDCGDGCPIKARFGIGDSCWRDGIFDTAEFERIVMKWAVEHPEPVYPMWDEVLAMEYRKAHDIMPIVTREEVLEWACNTPIPADIAEKLGIEPIGGSDG